MTLSLKLSVESALSKYSERTVITMPSHGDVTYGTLEAKAKGLSQELVALGIDNGILGLCLKKSPFFLFSLAGSLMAELPYVPMDVEAPMNRNKKILEIGGIEHVMIESADIDRWTSFFSDLEVIQKFEEDRYVLIHIPRLTEQEVVLHADLAYVLFTSGSTGEPKGVQLTHQNALAFVNWSTESLVNEEGMVFSSIAPFHFDLSVFDIYSCILTGGRLVLFDAQTIKNPRLVAQILDMEGVQMVYATPTILRLLHQYGKLEKYQWESLETVLFAGEIFSPSSLKELSDKWPNVRWYNLYGPTETNVVTYHQVEPTDLGSSLPSIPIGRMCSQAIFMLRDEAGAVISAGEGELMISGPTVTPGYLGGVSEEVFVKADLRTWYCTGDWVMTDQTGKLVFVGRQDGMIKRRGYRIELGEIEAAYSDLEAISSCKAVAIEDSGETKIFLAVILNEGYEISLIEFKSHGVQHLPIYMLPDAFKNVEAWPMTATHKLDNRKLKEIVQDQIH